MTITVESVELEYWMMILEYAVIPVRDGIIPDVLASI